MRTILTVTLERAIAPLQGENHIQQLCDDALMAIETWKKRQTERHGEISDKSSTSIEVKLSWLTKDEYADIELNAWFIQHHIKVKDNLLDTPKQKSPHYAGF